MRKLFVTLMASLLSCSAAFAFWPEATDSSLEIGVGYRRDKLEWKTRVECDDCDGYYGDEYSPFLPFGLGSDVKWHNLNIWQIEAKGKYVTCDNIYLRANADYGWITSGKNRDCDSFSVGDYSFYDSFYGNNRFSESKSKARGHVYDAKIALGYQFKMCDDSFAIAPLVGYSWNGQHIEDRHLKQDSCFDDEYYTDYYGTYDYDYNDYYDDYGYDCDYSSYSYGGRHSKYNARWNGPFIGFDFDYRFGCGCEADWEIFGGYEFHWATYHAKADWFLRRDLCDGFHHKAKRAFGHVFDIGIKWDFCECWTLALKGEFQWWCAHKGHDRAKLDECSFCDARTTRYLRIPLRDIKWQSASVSIDVGMVF